MHFVVNPLAPNAHHFSDFVNTSLKFLIKLLGLIDFELSLQLTWIDFPLETTSMLSNTTGVYMTTGFEKTPFTQTLVPAPWLSGQRWCKNIVSGKNLWNKILWCQVVCSIFLLGTQIMCACCWDTIDSYGSPWLRMHLKKISKGHLIQLNHFYIFLWCIQILD